jgi:2-amino-4-hydroxy-6-hydroxymethyldihydropteridine diphosphokinase
MNHHSLLGRVFPGVKPLVRSPRSRPEMSARPPAFLALGTNLGDREQNLEHALRALGALGVRTRRRSSLYLTEPVGGPPQDWFVNAAAEVETELSAEALRAACLEVEREQGRVRTVKDGPRLLDLDLLLYRDLVRRDPSLEVPHPRMHLRRFVLVPLDEIAPDALHPVLGLTVRELLAGCPDSSEVRLLTRPWNT